MTFFMLTSILLLAAAQPVEDADDTSEETETTEDTEAAEELPSQVMLSWTPGEVSCSATPVRPATMQRPYGNVIARPSSEVFPVIYTFEIDESGRTVSIRRISERRRRIMGQDIAPALAASRFAPGAPHNDCTIIYRPQISELAEAELSDLMRYAVVPLSVPLPEAARARLYNQGDCHDTPRPEPQRRLFPNFRAMPRTAGVRDWIMISYDIDDSGRTQNVTLMDSTGNAALDSDALEAVDGSRYYDGPKQECRYSYWLGAATMPPPPSPTEEEYRPDDATCPVNHEWATKPALRYPTAYNRRAIEGWAFITYDIAESGELENISVADSQPSEDFGVQASAIMRSAKAKAGEVFTGCVLKTRFRMPES
ncbi:energy transducer TonB [Alterisphingorhabdus coralli]|uniref:Energy transducer TonB n=1 Tax=Alterisphingorhabdus coralli TaxID=3071408 RepID=A0AA97HZQ7_9SPHN|nr:energy transducer TonB [Parasphingorhabdus sp. SCSIO 66989]WOE74989.1 energy transducer TonB [Parasphingorhabdus sp. SCSIO 66989]